MPGSVGPNDKRHYLLTAIASICCYSEKIDGGYNKYTIQSFEVEYDMTHSDTDMTHSDTNMTHSDTNMTHSDTNMTHSDTNMTHSDMTLI